MNRRDWLMAVGGISLLLFAFQGCGNAGTTGSNPGTSTVGPVVISTNHSRYTPNDTVLVSIINHLQTSIYAYDTKASCTILGLQIQTNGNWQNTQISRCALGRMAILVEIPSGKTYNASITAGTPGVSSTGFPPGIYRLVLKYSTSPTGIAQIRNQGTTTIYSQSIVVSN